MHVYFRNKGNRYYVEGESVLNNFFNEGNLQQKYQRRQLLVSRDSQKYKWHSSAFFHNTGIFKLLPNWIIAGLSEILYIPQVGKSQAGFSQRYF